MGSDGVRGVGPGGRRGWAGSCWPGRGGAARARLGGQPRRRRRRDRLHRAADRAGAGAGRLRPAPRRPATSSPASPPSRPRRAVRRDPGGPPAGRPVPAGRRSGPARGAARRRGHRRRACRAPPCWPRSPGCCIAANDPGPVTPTSGLDWTVLAVGRVHARRHQRVRPPGRDVRHPARGRPGRRLPGVRGRSAAGRSSRWAVGGVALGVGLLVTRLVETFGRPAAGQRSRADAGPGRHDQRRAGTCPGTSRSTTGPRRCRTPADAGPGRPVA